MIALDEVATSLTNFPNVLRSLLAPVDPHVLAERPEPGEWCVREVIGHLIAADSGAFRDRIAAIVAGDSEIAPFGPWDAINERNFAETPLEELLAELEVERARTGRFVAALDPADLLRTATYGEHGVFQAGDFVLEWPFHDQDHLKQIVDNLKPYYTAHMTDTMRGALTGEAH